MTPQVSPGPGALAGEEEAGGRWALPGTWLWELELVLLAPLSTSPCGTATPAQPGAGHGPAVLVGSQDLGGLTWSQPQGRKNCSWGASCGQFAVP